jgi:hypothetical protein
MHGSREQLSAAFSRTSVSNALEDGAGKLTATLMHVSWAKLLLFHSNSSSVRCFSNRHCSGSSPGQKMGSSAFSVLA